jgi:pyruvate,orthophosphate dikinase
VTTSADRIIEAVRGAEAGAHSREDAVRAVSTDDVNDVLHATVGDHEAQVLCSGIAASPGAGVGKLCLSVDAVLDVVDHGGEAVLVAMETGPEDEPGMRWSAGIVTAHGGLASHAAIYSRGMGIPAVCGVEGLVVEDDRVRVGDVHVAEGEIITVDGASGTVLIGGLDVDDADAPPELDTLLGWADDIRADRVGIRANADTGADAAEARRLGAQGIGLCRTEHMFLGDRLPVVRRMLTSITPEEHDAALYELQEVQRVDFRAVFEAMDGLPVTVRLLDAPLHEFLEESHEQNPMLGLRGIRLALVTEGLYRAQVRAVLEAMADRIEAGGNPVVEIMIPLVSIVDELEIARTWVDDEVAAAELEGVAVAVAVGTMIETPRAALRAGELAAHADFVSFGTNDLTQMTYGFSRDDVEKSVIAPYMRDGLLDRSPFDVLDRDGVGELVELGVERGRATKPDLKAGICGEHGGDPSSIEFVVGLGLDYVSCSPPRVPTARLAVARALLDD